MKIVYVFESLAYKGGAERIVSERMSYLADNGYDVSTITFRQFPNKTPNTYYLSSKVKQIDFQIDDFKQYRYKYPIRLFIKWRYYKLIKNRLQKTIDKIQPNIIIGMSYALANFVCKIRTNSAIIIEAHEARQFTMSRYSQDNEIPWYLRLYYKLYRYNYIHIIEKYADVVVTLTHSDAKQWYKAKRVEVIPNFSGMPITRLSDGSSKRAIAVGRLCWQKGYDRLIEAWILVTKRHPDWQLDIYGEGRLDTELKKLLLEKKTSNIFIHPFTSNISEKYADSSICLLTSRFEGFSLVLLEALQHGVPCIAFDCPYGPSDVIDNEKCGFVIKDGDIQNFADKVCYLIEEPKVKEKFSKKAIQKGASYDKEAIMQQWKNLFSSLNKNNK